MMISPETYMELHRNDTFPQLLKEKDTLVEELHRLEKIVFSENHESDEWMVHPDPQVRYQMNLEYLAKLCFFISKKYNKEIVWAGCDWGENE